MAWSERDVEQIAREFHERYEYLAPTFQWQTNHRSRVPWHKVPVNNRRLMLAVVRSLLQDEEILAP